ncbi:unnamed protein product [Diatraea saccharalis]|uniref:ATP-dependent DNA helicase n=1 Tax=Diatraea saccharalis TaxID=40085 RepID=A0A9N9R939_9NEOP|nr:unnamed protein product [Diatraea saccharalis]
MSHKRAVEALNRSLLDIRSNETLMGGAVVVLTGDFRQTLPVIEKDGASRVYTSIDTVMASDDSTAYPVEFLNSLELTGVPPHKLELKDECTMSHKRAVEALNRSLLDIRSNETLMGGAVVVLTGDFRQTLPVIEKGTPANEMNACLKAS